MSLVKCNHTLRSLSASTVLALLMLVPQTGLAEGRSGNVYVPTNQPTGNSIMVFHRDAAGAITFVESVASGGIGAGTGGDPLASQGAVVLSRDNRLLFAVNAGSDSISVFAVSGDQLVLLDTVASGGTLPVSLTVRGNLLYVLNAGGTPNISGFTIESRTNRLIPLSGSTQSLPGGVAAMPAQVSFSPDDSVLVVTEKGTNRIDTFAVEDDGVASPSLSFPSSGSTPFGFAFSHDNVAIVSDAGSGALSSYAVDEEGNLDLVTPALSDTQAAPCWVVVPRNGRFAYTANAGSGTISSYAVGENGNLALLDAAAGSVAHGSAPTDMALSNNSRFLYVRNGGNGTISGFRLNADGSLTPVSTIGGLPAGTQGIAAR
ncbi:MAG TPA: beta-propeller fold lactonase family protein [Acidobacteriota bacterium]|nr:beta-propeller fold lactonase family protein [Acidobacteriota bacterium]